MFDRNIISDLVVELITHNIVCNTYPAIQVCLIWLPIFYSPTWVCALGLVSCSMLSLASHSDIDQNGFIEKRVSVYFCNIPFSQLREYLNIWNIGISRILEYLECWPPATCHSFQKSIFHVYCNLEQPL